MVVRGVHGSGWIGLRRFFDLIHHGELKKIQSSPTHHISPTQLTMGRVGQFFLLLLLLN